MPLTWVGSNTGQNLQLLEAYFTKEIQPSLANCPCEIGPIHNETTQAWYWSLQMCFRTNPELQWNQWDFYIYLQFITS